MKSLLATFLVVALTATASAKKAKVDFTPFKGTYSGSYLLSGGGTSYFAQVTVKVSVPKSGKTLTLVPSGILVASGITYPLGGSFVLGPGKSAQQVSVYFIPSVVPTFSTGTFSGKKNSFAFNTSTAVSGGTIPTSGTLVFHKNSLSFSLLGSLSGSAFTVNISAKKKK
jgi:hypothetical protein